VHGLEGGPPALRRRSPASGHVFGLGEHIDRIEIASSFAPDAPQLVNVIAGVSCRTKRKIGELNRRPRRAWRCSGVGARRALPVIWDADFLLGPKNASGQDSYVLCEINASSVFPITDEAPDAIAATLLSHFAGNR
jgi:hypothetical protein